MLPLNNTHRLLILYGTVYMHPFANFPSQTPDLTPDKGRAIESAHVLLLQTLWQTLVPPAWLTGSYHPRHGRGTARGCPPWREARWEPATPPAAAAPAADKSRVSCPPRRTVLQGRLYSGPERGCNRARASKTQSLHQILQSPGVCRILV